MIRLIPGPDAKFKKGQRVRYCGSGTSVASGAYGTVKVVYLGDQYEVCFDSPAVTLVTDESSLEAATTWTPKPYVFY